MTTSRPPSTTRRAGTARGPLRAVVAILKALAYTVAAIVVYAISINMFGGYPQVDSLLLNIIAVVLIALTGGLAWIIDERRDHGDE
jgi:hypothetical protein